MYSSEIRDRELNSLKCPDIFILTLRRTFRKLDVCLGINAENNYLIGL